MQFISIFSTLVVICNELKLDRAWCILSRIYGCVIKKTFYICDVGLCIYMKACSPDNYYVSPVS